MKIFSGTRSDYDEKIISDNRYWECRLEYFYLSWRALTASLVKDFTLSDYVSDGSNISMGSVAGGKLTVNLSGASYAQLSMIFEGAKIRLRLTLMDSVMLRSKTFIVDQKKINRRRDGKYDCTLTAFDVSYEMTDKYKTSIENPTCIQIVTEIANKYGLTVNESVSQAVAAIDGDTAAVFVPLDGFTCKQTLGYMAGCYGCYASINEDSEICFEWYSQSSDTIAPNRIFEGGEYISEMEQRTIKMIETGTQGNQIVAPSNANGYSVNFENPYISQSQATAIYNNKISGDKISFRTGKLKYKGSPLNNPGTIVTVEDIDGNTATFYIMKRTLNFDGGLSETIECQGESDTAISYKVTSPTQQKINRALSQMEEAIKAATGVIKQTQGSTFELIADETDESKNIGFKLYYKDSGDSSFDDCVIMATAGGIGFSTNKGESFDAAAIYFYKDDSGNIHGCINGEFIKAGSISADKINTNNLIISKGNVDGLEGDLSSLSSDVSSASQTAANAAEKANSVGDALTATNQNVSTLSTEQTKIINVCLTQDKTQINGGNIATGSILAGSLDANSVTADNLSVGIGKLINIFYNGDFSKNSSYPIGWDGYNSTLSVSNGIATAQYVAENSNLIGEANSEFINISNWTVTNCTMRKPYQDIDYIELKPISKDKWSIISTKVILSKGKKYSISAQINPLNWSSSSNSTQYISIGYHCNGSFYYGSDSARFTPSSGEANVEFVFDYNENDGNVDIGLFFRDMLDADGNPVSVNIAWIAVSEVSTTRSNGFYSSKSTWIKSSYLSTRLINNGVYISKASDYLASIAITETSQIQIMFQKKKLIQNSRYVLLARIQFLNLSSINSDADLGFWDGTGHSFSQKYIGSTSTGSTITVKMVFDYTGSSDIRDVGLYWKGILNDAGQPCKLKASWIYLYKDDTETVGFYCSSDSWLADNYKSSFLLEDSSSADDYIKKPALVVSENNLFFFGSVQSNDGVIGCLNYDLQGFSVENNSYYYEDKSSPDTSYQEKVNSYLNIIKPEAILDLKAWVEEVGTFDLCETVAWQSIRQELLLETDSAWYKNVISPAGIKITSDGGKTVSLSTNGLGISDSDFLTIEQIRYLINNTPKS